MRIGIVVPYFTPYTNGNEYGLAESLVSLGHELTIIASTAKAPREKKVVDLKNSNIYSDLKFSVAKDFITAELGVKREIQVVT